ncbi:BT4734/BF3469 family protein [Algoriphagus sanaruensis]|uniref:BT4734-like N-terminal domain-containing protein n=1 Tax=Algoriphagus sanaruensis TaxID=1727163 RepID=A0A142EKG1_9BACT|nr:BT4734/BF3469 family protein [Algoriphagus sanaruensis]AMQ55616.1 hypothetical protein AO498_04310 [Algoriphagus sanaruensis]
MNKSVLDVEVSCFANYWETKNARPVNLITWLTSEKFRAKVEEIRNTECKSKRDELKGTLPAITPSGKFSKRCESGLIKHSGFIQIDLDRQDNLHISNWYDLKIELMKLPEIAYLGKSVSGTGYWGLIPIPADPEGHKFYFDALEEIFFRNWGIKLDKKPKNIASLRGYSYDNEAHFNHQAKTFLKKKPPIKIPPPIFKIKRNNGSGLEDWVINKLESSQPGEFHSQRLKVGRIAGGLVAAGRLDGGILNQLIENYLNNFSTIDDKSVQKKEIKALRDGFENGLRSPLYD